MNAPQLDFAAIAPIAFTGFGALVVLLGEVWLSRRKTFLGRAVTEVWIGTVLAMVAAVFLGLAIYAAGATFAGGASITFDIDNPMLRLDGFAAYATALIGVASFLVCWLSIAYLAELRINHGEYYALLLLATSGMMLMVSAIDLLTVISINSTGLMSIPELATALIARGIGLNAAGRLTEWDIWAAERGFDGYGIGAFPTLRQAVRELSSQAPPP